VRRAFGLSIPGRSKFWCFTEIISDLLTLAILKEDCECFGLPPGSKKRICIKRLWEYFSESSSNEREDDGDADDDGDDDGAAAAKKDCGLTPEQKLELVRITKLQERLKNTFIQVARQGNREIQQLKDEKTMLKGDNTDLRDKLDQLSTEKKQLLQRLSKQKQHKTKLARHVKSDIPAGRRLHDH
jgi:hypothetical protein